MIIFPVVADGPGAAETVLLLNLILNIIPFLLTAIGYFCIARRRKIRRAWLSFVPVVNLWVLGAISDQFQQRLHGKTRRLRVWLPVAGVAAMALIAGFFAGMMAMLTALEGDFESAQGAAGIIMAIMVVSLLTVGVFTAFKAFRFVVLFDLYRSSLVRHSLIFLLLSIFSAVTEPFLIFYCRNKDYGFENPAQLQHTRPGA